MRVSEFGEVSPLERGDSVAFAEPPFGTAPSLPGPPVAISNGRREAAGDINTALWRARLS